MKRTKKTWFFFILQIVFILIAPCAFIWAQYGDVAVKYKVSVSAVILLILIFLIFKKIVLNKWLKTFEQKLVNIETAALSLTDPETIKTNKKAWRMYSLIRLFFDCVIPMLVLIIGILTIKAVEEGLIKLYGCLMFCTISIAVGIVFRVAEIYSMKMVNEKE